MSDILEGSIRWLANKMMPEFARNGQSANALDNAIKDMFGKSYRRQTLLDDYRKYTGFVKQEKGFQSVGYNDLIKKGVMTSGEVGHARLYRWYADATYTNDITGETTTKFISGLTDVSPSKSAWEAEFFEQFPQDDRYSGWSVTKLNFRGAEYNRRLFK